MIHQAKFVVIMHLGKEIWEKLSNELLFNYEKEEASNIIKMLLIEKYHLSASTLILNEPIDIDLRSLKTDMERLKKSEPIQYVLGKVYFHHLPFIVDHNVLIPRPETEELVNHVLSNVKSEMHILDIGTGSGCIAITIKKNSPDTHVMATDISEEALSIAKKNAKYLKTDVEFFRHNILKEEIPLDSLDLVISNPPYISQSEKYLLHSNVINYEPALALLVETSKPLVFYEAISKKALHKLKQGGMLFFEVHKNYAQQVVNLLQPNYSNIEIITDIYGKERIVTASLNE